MEYGIFVAEPGGTVQKDPQFDSTLNHLQIDVVKESPHLAVLDDVTAKQAFVDSSSEFYTQSEILFEIEHNYGFKPYTLAYFYLYKLDFDESGEVYPLTGSYGNDFFSIGAGAADDYIITDVDEKYFRILHKLDSFGAQTGAVSQAPKYHFRVKYYITSSPLGS